MTNEEMLLRALMGEEVKVETFHPQTNKQAYLAYAVGFITDPDLLPEPRTNEEVLLLQVCLNGTGGGGGTVLPVLVNPATAAEILAGYEAIDQTGAVLTGENDCEEQNARLEARLNGDGSGGGIVIVLPALANPASGLELLEGYDAIDADGNVIYGDIEDNSGKRMLVRVDLDSGIASVPRGFHDGITGVRIEVEEQTVTPSDTEQEIVPSGGAVLGKVIVKAAPAAEDPWRITDASYLFYKGARLDDAANFLHRCGKITTAKGMFLLANFLSDVDFTQINLAGLDFSECLDMSYMFSECSELLRIGGTNYFDTSAVEDMSYMFHECRAIPVLDLTGFNTKSVTNMERMFYNCDELTEIKGIEDFDTRNVKRMYWMFRFCTALENLDLSKWNTSKVENMEYLFDGCESLKTLNLSGWDTSNVHSMECMFADCHSLTKLDLSGFDTTNCGNYAAMFANDEALEEIIGFSMVGATGGIGGAYVSVFPEYGALRRLTFRTDLPEGQIPIEGNVSIRGCKFERADMVETFNSLPDITNAASYDFEKVIVIAGNPCVTGLRADGTACDLLTAEDKAIATAKGWQIIETEEA